MNALKRLLPSFWPLLVGTLCLGVTLWLWSHEQQSEDARLRTSFDFGLRQATSRIEERIGSYEQMLRGAQGLLMASDHIDRPGFNRYIDNLLSGADAAGLLSISYGPLLKAAEVPAHVQAQQRSGVSDYALRPPGIRAQAAPATFTGPQSGANLAALGYDPLSDPLRSAAMWRAGESGGTAITDKLQFSVEPGNRNQPGFLMFLPLYAKGQAIDTAAARRAQLTGWVWAAFRLDDMMSSLYGEGAPGIALSIYDGTTLSAKSLMYSSGHVPGAARSRFEAVEYIGFAGHSWTLQVRTEPEFEHIHSRGSASILAAAGVGLSLLLALLTYQLVTARARAHALAQTMTRELRDSEERYRRIVDTSQEGIWTLDAGARITYANPMMQRMLGQTAAGMQGRPLADFLDDPAQAAPFQLVAPQTAALADRREHHELKLRRWDGSALWVSMSVSTIADGDAGGPVGTLGMVTDITERKDAEARRSLLEVQLRESQKMEAVGTLAGGIAHDFNNILAVILGNVATAREEAGAGRPTLQNLAQIDRAAVRARSLVQQILAFSRMQPQALVSQPLRPLVEDVLTLLRSTLPAQVELDVRLADTPLHAGADATQVQQVLMNLCTNAWHALKGSRGRISIGLDQVRLSAESARVLGGIRPGAFAHLWVADTGCGMDQATRARVFEPFFTTKRVGQGTGLGLSVVHGIIRAHHGAVDVDSGPGRGSRFDVYLPLLAPPPVALPAPVAPPEPAPGRGEHVLYIDDDPAMLIMVEALLERAGYRVSAIGSPREALQLIEAPAAPFAVIVTDYNMPELTGLDIARTVARVRPDVPVLITSGYISDDLRTEARQTGVVRSLLQKEYTLEQLVGLVQAALTTPVPSRHSTARGAP